MDWYTLKHSEDLQSLLEHSYTEPCFILKHSTRCSISSVAVRRVERSKSFQQIATRWYLVDVISHRQISNQIAADFDIRHESPQLIVVIEGRAVWYASHLGISPNDLPDVLSKYSTN